MKRLIRLLVGLVIALGALNAQARIYNQGELDALLAPIALYPDPLLNNILDAVRYPDDVMAAGDWSRANPGLQGDAALQAVDGAPWAPSVKSLVAYPDILARLVESPQWLADLGDAYATHGSYIQTTIQQLRARAQSSGYLQSNAQQNVYEQTGQIYVQPVYPTVVYAPYYNPYVVYGTWWWPAYRPWAFRPFYARPIVVTRVARPVHYVVRPYHAVPEARRMPIIGSPPRLGHPQVQSRPVATPPARFAERLPQRAPVSAPHAQVSAPRAQIAAPRAQVATPPARFTQRMPAPQVRVSERPVGVGHSGAAQASGNRGGGGKHRG
ncbi:MAG TPA: DUF3300 domain-containing protein [Burkholderiales bacterium]|nr:DUF3300 domain-containing protein [Burkholderiales bacterium]